jgi:hypothetical protein
MDNCTAQPGSEVEEACAASGVVVPLIPHSSNSIQPVDLSKFGITKRTITGVVRMKIVNVQSGHISQVVSGFISAASPLNVVRMLASAGLVLMPSSEGKLLWPVCREQAIYLVNKVGPVMETEAGDDEVKEIHFEHCAEIIVQEMPNSDNE